MQQFPRSVAQEVGNIDSPYERPKVILLDERHWSYIQKRYHISPRELEVAKLVCHGLSNREIADALDIKPAELMRDITKQSIAMRKTRMKKAREREIVRNAIESTQFKIDLE